MAAKDGSRPRSLTGSPFLGAYPALLNRVSTRIPSSRSPPAKARTDSNDARSSRRGTALPPSPAPPPAAPSTSALMRSAAAEHLASDRHARTTVAPYLTARARAAS